MLEDYKRLERLIEENLSISKENNKLLEKIKKNQRIILWSKVFYFLIVTGFIFGAFYYVAPIIKNTLNIYENLPHIYPDVTNYVPYLNEIKDLIPGRN